jgi:Na+-translocating ferredoxin:NAD+ oxidoreductase RnfC subunit
MSLTDKIFEAGIVGCGGAGFPTHVKLNTKVEHLIINAAECEPLLRTDRYIMCHKASEIISACEEIRRHLNAADCTIALKSAYKEEIASLNVAILAQGSKVKIHETESFYPAGDEQVMVYEVTGRVVPPSGIPLDVGCVVENVATVFAISEALNGKPFTHKFLTVTGEVNKPTVLYVPLGTSFADCLKLAGGEKEEDYFVISGGPMMGKPLTKEQAASAVVTKTTSGFLILPKDSKLPSLHMTPIEHTINRARSACIQCTFCTELCPRHMLGHPLEPHKIMRKLALDGSIEAILDSEVVKNALICCECGVCEIYACPMQLQPRKVNILIKQEFAKRGIRYKKPDTEFEADINREYRKIPTRRAAERAGVGAYYDIQIRNCVTFEPDKVEIPLKQNIGAPSEPTVNSGDKVICGDLIAKCQDGKLGANLHASIDGTVTVMNDKIIIEK